MNHSPTTSTAALVGRKTEQQELADALRSGRPEHIAIYRRRRVRLAQCRGIKLQHSRAVDCSDLVQGTKQALE